MKTIYSIAALILVVGLFSSCKKDHSTVMGTPICASADFQYTQNFTVNGLTNPADADFTALPYNVSLTAGFNETVSWTITITGQTSGAVKTYTGSSNVVDVKWWGNADGNVFFQDGEDCKVALQPSCKASEVVMIKIAHKAVFDHYGLLLFDLDQYYGSANPGVSPQNMDIIPSDPSPQGGKCHMMSWPAGNTGWYMGQYIKSTSAMSGFAAGAGSDEIYVNFYLKGDPSTIFTLVVFEEVNGNLCPFRKNMTINWTGWKMISVKLSDINVVDPTKITEIDLVPTPIEYNGKMECYVDFLIITKGKPFSGAN